MILSAADEHTLQIAISHCTAKHSQVRGEVHFEPKDGEPLTTTNPGEFELGRLGAQLLPADSASASSELLRAMFYADGIRLLSFEPLDSAPTDAQLQDLGSVDVVVMNLAADSLPTTGLKKLIEEISPRILVFIGTPDAAAAPLRELNITAVPEAVVSHAISVENLPTNQMDIVLIDPDA